MISFFELVSLQNWRAIAH